MLEEIFSIGIPKSPDTGPGCFKILIYNDPPFCIGFYSSLPRMQDVMSGPRPDATRISSTIISTFSPSPGQ